MTSSPWGNEKMKVLAKCFEIFRYKNGELSVVMGLFAARALYRGSAVCGGEGQGGDEGHCWKQRLSRHQGRSARGLTQDGPGFSRALLLN